MIVVVARDEVIDSIRVESGFGDSVGGIEDDPSAKGSDGATTAAISAFFP